MNKIINKNITELVNNTNIKDNSIDCIIADPPYNIGQSFGTYNNDNKSIKEYIQWCNTWISELERVLSISGTGFIYGFDEVLAHISVNIKLPHRWLIWHYTNKNVVSNNFWQRSHESIIVFWKDKNKRIFNSDFVREPYGDSYLKLKGKVRKGTIGRFSKSNKETIYNVNELGAGGRDVIKLPTLAGRAGCKERIYYCNTCNDIFIGNKNQHLNHSILEHPTQKPKKLTQKLLMSCMPYSPKELKFSGTVLIPFAGSGSECLWATQLGMEFIAGDINPEYVKLGNMLLDKYGKSKV